MKVLYIVGAFPYLKCGVGDYTKIISEEVSKCGNDVSIITSNTVDYKSDKLEIYNIVDKWNNSAINIILNKLKQIKPDIVHIQYPSNEYKKNLMINFLPYIIKRKLKCKVIITIHEYSDCSKLGKIRNLLSAVLADKVIVVEKKYIRDMSTVLKFKNKLEYIPIYSSIPKSILDYKQILKMKENLKIQNNKIISYFGFINKLKGFESLIEILKKNVEDDNSVKLIVIGELDKDNEYHKKLLNKIEEYNLKSNIIITGFIKSDIEVSNYLKMSDVCILPFANGVSERNSSFLAAYVQDIPIITTYKKGEDLKLTDDSSVYYFSPDNINNGIELCRNVLNNCNVIVKREVNDKKIIIEKHLEIYKNIQGSRIKI